MIRWTKGKPKAVGEKDLPKTEKVRKKRAIQDPCSPPMRNIVEELYLAMFGQAARPESLEERIVGRDYLVEYERAKRRIHPRISEFGRME